MKKTIILLICLLLFSGCVANVDLNISKDTKVSEKIILSESKEVVDNNIIDYDTFINIKKELYNDILVNNNYLINTDINEFDIIADLQNDYPDICNYFHNSKSVKYVLKNIYCKKEYDYYQINTIIKKFNVCGEYDCEYNAPINSLNLNITLPNKAKRHNADKVNGNTYTWYFDGSSDKKLELEFKIKGNNETDINNKKMIKTVLILILGIIVIISISGVLLYNKYQKNKLEY